MANRGPVITLTICFPPYFQGFRFRITKAVSQVGKTPSFLPPVGPSRPGPSWASVASFPPLLNLVIHSGIAADIISLNFLHKPIPDWPTLPYLLGKLLQKNPFSPLFVLSPCPGTFIGVGSSTGLLI